MGRTNDTSGPLNALFYTRGLSRNTNRIYTVIQFRTYFALPHAAYCRYMKFNCAYVKICVTCNSQKDGFYTIPRYAYNLSPQNIFILT
jgi:hypothetical protein